MAAFRVFQNSILHPIQTVTSVQYGFMQQRQLFWGDVASRVRARCTCVRHSGDHEIREEVGGVAGDDAVVITGKTLRLREPLFAA
jgi:hypothetical protein